MKPFNCLLSVQPNYNACLRTYGFEKWTIKNHFAYMKNGFAGMKNHFSGMQNSFSGMKNYFPGMQNGFAGMKNRFAGLQKHFACMKKHFSGIRDPFSAIRMYGCVAGNCLFRSELLLAVLFLPFVSFLILFYNLKNLFYDSKSSHRIFSPRRWRAGY